MLPMLTLRNIVKNSVYLGSSFVIVRPMTPDIHGWYQTLQTANNLLPADGSPQVREARTMIFGILMAMLQAWNIAERIEMPGDPTADFIKAAFLLQHYGDGSDSPDPEFTAEAWAQMAPGSAARTIGGAWAYAGLQKLAWQVAGCDVGRPCDPASV